MSTRTGSGRFGVSTDRYGSEAIGRYFTRVLPVFGIMLLITAVTIGGMIATGLADLVAGFGIVGYVALLVVQVGTFYAAQATQEYYPFNVLLAVGFAAFEGVFLAPFVAGFLGAGMGYVLTQAFVATSVAFVGLSAYPIVTGTDFSFLGSFLFAAVLGLIGISVLGFFVGFPGPIGLAINVASVVIFSLFVLYDMSKILDGSFGAVAGAIGLYLDFVLIFVNLAQILGALEE